MIRERATFGIAGLDEMLDDGLLVGRPYVVSGTTGTGKTTVCMQFLLEGAKNGERVLYVAVDEPPNEVRANMEKYGWDLSGVSVLDGTPDILNYDKTPVRDVSSERRVTSLGTVGDSIRRTSEKGPSDVTINTIQELIKQEFKERKYSRLVIDSLTSLKFFYIRTSEEFAVLQSFFRTLSDLGVTSLLAVEVPEISRPGIESQLARGEIRLHRWFDGRGLMRGVTVEKYRGSSHESRMQHMKFTPGGVEVTGSGKPRGKPKTEPKPKPEKVGEARDAKGAEKTPEVSVVSGKTEPKPVGETVATPAKDEPRKEPQEEPPLPPPPPDMDDGGGA